MMKSWQGSAATAAQGYFNRLTDEQRATLFDPDRPPTPDARLAELTGRRDENDDFAHDSVLNG